MDNKINFYGFETGVLLEKLDKEFDHYACNNKELNYGFYSNPEEYAALIGRW